METNNRKHTVLQISRKSAGTFTLRISREDLVFTSGQCINLGIPSAGVNREYSIYSGETDDYLEFLIRHVEGGAVSSALSQLKAGDAVDIHGPFGAFTLKKEFSTLPHFFVATGTGIAPFHSFVRSHPALDYKIVHGVRSEDEMYDAKHYLEGRYIPCLSKGSAVHFSGRVTQYFAELNFTAQAVFYLCGNSAMINAMYDLLRKKGVSSDHLFIESFF